MPSIVDPPTDSKSEPPECATCGKRQWPVIHSCTGVRQPTAPPEGLELRCPYCGDEITPDLEYRPGSYSEHRDHVGYECDNCQCDARWDRRGGVERVSKLVSGVR